MIKGLSLEQLGRKIVDEKAMQRDFMVPTTQLQFAVENSRPKLKLMVAEREYVADMTDFAFRQLTEFAGIPSKYVDRMNGQLPDLLQQNVEQWLFKLAERRMLRAFDNGQAMTVRAFLSEKYRKLDNIDLLAHAIPVIKDLGLEVLSSQVTETRLYVQAVHPTMKAQVERAKLDGVSHGFQDIQDEVQAMMVLSNSEVGAGSLRVETGFYRAFCTNGAIVGDCVKRYHVGGRGGNGDGEEATELFTDRTKQLDDAAFWSKVNDVMRGAFDEARFQKLVAKINLSTEVALPDAGKAIELTQEKFGLTEDEKSAMLNHLIGGGETTQFGLFNALTRTAQDARSYDRAIELERFGGQLLELDRAAIAKWTN